MNLKKLLSAVLLLGMCVACVLAVKHSVWLKNWMGRLSATGESVSDNINTLSYSDGEKLSGNPSGREASPGDALTEATMPPFPSEVEIPASSQAPETEKEKDVVLPTTIQGGMALNNSTGFKVDIDALLRAGPSQKLPKDGVQILIIHTHGSEAYTPDAEASYTSSDAYRTEDKNYSVIRVGDELTACLESYGLSVLHDREIYDYPSYTGSYSRSGEAVEKYLKQYPEIAIVIDLHRDALGSNGVVYKTVAEDGDQASSQLMLLVGTGEKGLYHPKWQENMKLALYMQSAVLNKYPTLARPIAVTPERYNQHLTTGSLILEVGSSGNTLSEALQAVRLFAGAVGPVLKELVDN